MVWEVGEGICEAVPCEVGCVCLQRSTSQEGGVAGTRTPSESGAVPLSRGTCPRWEGQQVPGPLVGAGALSVGGTVMRLLILLLLESLYICPPLP